MIPSLVKSLPLSSAHDLPAHSIIVVFKITDKTLSSPVYALGHLSQRERQVEMRRTPLSSPWGELSSEARLRGRQSPSGEAKGLSVLARILTIAISFVYRNDRLKMLDISGMIKEEFGILPALQSCGQPL